MTTTVAVFAILASAVVVLGGLVALTRALWTAASDLRDFKRVTMENKEAIDANTTAMTELNLKLDGRLDDLEQRMAMVEGKLSAGQNP